MKYRHYAPDAPLVLLDGELDEIVKYIKNDNPSDIAIICYSEQKSLLIDQIPDAAIYTLGAQSNITEQAHHLFSILREVDGVGYKKIYAPLPPREGMGLALYNRMIRAAAHTVINLRQDKNG
jgi:L-threonylcarbamoyladenylate synthase